nr:hypothetical protein [Fodinicola feengrottensis]
MPAPVRLSRARLVTAVCGWGVLIIVGMLVAAGPLGALSESRAQHGLLADFRQQVTNSAAAAQSPLGAIVPTKPAEPGTAVALLQIPRLGLQRGCRRRRIADRHPKRTGPRIRNRRAGTTGQQRHRRPSRRLRRGLRGSGKNCARATTLW